MTKRIKTIGIYCVVFLCTVITLKAERPVLGKCAAAGENICWSEGAGNYILIYCKPQAGELCNNR